MSSVGNGPGFGPTQPLPSQHGMQCQSSNYSQIYLTPTDIHGQTLPTTNLLPPMYPSQPANQLMPQMYLSQPLNLSYFPPNQEQFPNMWRPPMAPVPYQTYNQQNPRMTSTSEDEEDSTHIAQEIPWQTVKGMKIKKQD